MLIFFPSAKEWKTGSCLYRFYVAGLHSSKAITIFLFKNVYVYKLESYFWILKWNKSNFFGGESGEVLEIELRTSCILSTHSTTDPHTPCPAKSNFLKDLTNQLQIH